jgi:hypothetical protein
MQKQKSWQGVDTQKAIEDEKARRGVHLNSRIANQQECMPPHPADKFKD